MKEGHRNTVSSFGYFTLPKNQSLLDPQVLPSAFLDLLIFPHSVAHFYSYFQLVIPVFMNLICIHLERWDASSWYLFFVSKWWATPFPSLSSSD